MGIVVRLMMMMMMMMVPLSNSSITFQALKQKALDGLMEGLGISWREGDDYFRKVSADTS